MQSSRLMEEALDIARRVSRDPRLEPQLQPRLHAVICDLHAVGANVPSDLRDLERRLFEDAVEAQFDNLPV